MDEGAGAATEEREVAGADPPARADQHADQGGVGRGVLEDFADGDEVGDLGQMQQPGEADDLHGDVPVDQFALDTGEIGGGAAQYGDLAGRGAGADEVGEGVGEPGELFGVGGQQGAADDAVAFGSGGGAQRFDALVHPAQRCGEAVG